MGFLSGLGNLFGIGGSGTTAKNATRRAQWNPPQMSLPGFSMNYTLGKGPKGRDSVTTGFDANNQALRDGFYGAAGQGLSGILAPQANVGGYGGISPELFSEFGLANEQGGALPPQFYDQAGFDSLLGGARDAGNAAWGEFAGLMQDGGAANYGGWLDLLRQRAADQENKYLQGGMDKQFLKGILGSTAGQYQTQGMMDSLNSADLDRQLQAYGMSQDALNQALGRATTATGQFQGMEGDAANRGFLLNQLSGTRATDRFARAMQLFGTGQGANQTTFNRNIATLGAGAGGVSAQDQQLMSMLGLQGNLASARSGANANAGQIRTAYDTNQQGLWTSMINTATQTAGEVAGAMLSDRRLKTDIEKLGEIDGVNVYKWKYLWGEEAVGVMADEVPWAVIGQIGGYDVVDLGRVF